MEDRKQTLKNNDRLAEKRRRAGKGRSNCEQKTKRGACRVSITPADAGWPDAGAAQRPWPSPNRNLVAGRLQRRLPGTSR